MKVKINSAGSSHKGSLHLDVLLASLIFAVCAGLTPYLYSKAMQSERGEQSLVNRVPIGISSYTLVQEGDAGNPLSGAARCVGYVKLEVLEKDLLEIHVKGELGIELNSARQNARFSYSGYVNPLGQMFRSKFTLNFLNTNLLVNASDVRPLL